MLYEEMTPETIQRLRASGFVAVVVQVKDALGRKAGEVVSRHRTLAAAQRRADSNQVVKALTQEETS